MNDLWLAAWCYSPRSEHDLDILLSKISTERWKNKHMQRETQNSTNYLCTRISELDRQSPDKAISVTGEFGRNLWRSWRSPFSKQAWLEWVTQFLNYLIFCTSSCAHCTGHHWEKPEPLITTHTHLGYSHRVTKPPSGPVVLQDEHSQLSASPL